MRAEPGLRKILIVWAAAYVLALSAVIGSFASALAYSALDPTLGSICHNSEDATQPSAPKRTDCNHCVLCQVPSGSAVLPAIAAILEPVGADAALIARPLAAHTRRPMTSAQARAPPFQA